MSDTHHSFTKANFGTPSSSFHTKSVSPFSLSDSANLVFADGEYFDDRISQESFDNGSFPCSRASSLDNSPVAPNNDTFEIWSSVQARGIFNGSTIEVPILDEGVPAITYYGAKVHGENRGGDTVPNSTVLACQDATRAVKTKHLLNVQEDLVLLKQLSSFRQEDFQQYQREQANKMSDMRCELADLKLRVGAMDQQGKAPKNHKIKRDMMFLRLCLTTQDLRSEDREKALQIVDRIERPDFLNGDRLVYLGERQARGARHN